MQTMSQDVINLDKTPRTPQGQSIICKKVTRASAKVKQSLPIQYSFSIKTIRIEYKRMYIQ
eukprot:3295316-Ditylum_brightwellii.AAC.1